MRTATHQFQCLVRQHGGDAGQGEKVKLDEIKDFAQKLVGMSFCWSVISGAQVRWGCTPLLSLYDKNEDFPIRREIFTS